MDDFLVVVGCFDAHDRSGSTQTEGRVKYSLKRGGCERGNNFDNEAEPGARKQDWMASKISLFRCEPGKKK